MKKIIIFVFFGVLFLASCKKENDKSNYGVPPQIKPNALVLYIEEMNDDPTNTKNALYSLTNLEEKTMCN